ncbi:uncharacterized protein [Primulina eburnea]|uniref:uncharacterized protein n=1 Tax=Primulina eburnea TaxID=1245227 RepID=UPI003C6C6457
MFSILRCTRAQTPSTLFPSYQQKIIGKTSKIRYAQAAAGHGESDRMDKLNEQLETDKGDTMSHSFGEGYATRSEEEGFGGTYARNQTLNKEDEEDKVVHENQGSEVKEKESGRDQCKPAS